MSALARPSRRDVAYPVASPPLGDAVLTTPPRPEPSPLRGIDLIWILGLNIFVITGMWVRHGGLDGLDTASGRLTAVGQLTGLYGTLGILVQLVLIARLPWMERRYGMNRLNLWHRWNGFASTWLLLIHAVTITLGNSGLTGLSLWRQTVSYVTEYPWLLAAFVGTAALVAVTVTSLRAARRALSYETWWFVHLYAYLGVALAFGHQLAIGTDFVGDWLARVYWVFLYLLVAVALVGYRLLVPLGRGLRHRLRVAAVTPEAPGIVTVELAGRNLSRLQAEAGQFFLLRCIRPDRWWKAHPFSLSAPPDGNRLLFGIKAVGDDSTALQTMPVGTRVLAEGPYGAFTRDLATRSRVLLIAGGIGITPMKALFEDLDRPPGDVALLYRARDRSHAAFHDELVDIATRRGYDLHFSFSRKGGPRGFRNPFEPSRLTALIPDITQRDVFVCGPPSLLDAASNGLRRAGVPHRQIHLERFDY